MIGTDPGAIKFNVSEDDTIDLIVDAYGSTSGSPGTGTTSSAVFAVKEIARLPVIVRQRADYIIYDDEDDGFYKAIRTSDDALVASHPTDAAAVINDLLGSLSLVYSPASPDPDFREGLKVVMSHGVYHIYQNNNKYYNEILITTNILLLIHNLLYIII